ncbi:hypothetical protein QQS21_001056 [Conoideocrella luteorostrata]|uniref:SUN domain-containing protein n=1 Tax=Conoideocrella luteorostrata TaxID=1105319 RepID=A0AAJ0G261_9HYPO|nr:hypothetical protein QQS21_001056 [Conoideocrella luteorostrata]
MPKCTEWHNLLYLALNIKHSIVSYDGRRSLFRISMAIATTLLRGVSVFLWLSHGVVVAANDTKAVLTVNKTGAVAAKASPFGDLTNPDICEARTINYITHALPQSCLTSSWKTPSRTSSATTTSQPTKADRSLHITDTHVHEPATTVLDHNATGAQATEPIATTFMSFEDWKEMMLRRAGQDPQDLRSRIPSEHHGSDRYSPDVGHAGLGEEGEISLNFERYIDGDDKAFSPPRHTNGDSAEHHTDDNDLVDNGKAATVHLSKDAGKTCKERFSYSSFDAGATILKTSPGAKNAKAILVENKDTYMLLECDASSKYVIVELSDDISVDTVVLANYEFFSSMVRQFRISVSDRYPVKIDKWRDLGTFEARNSRDIQPFLVKNPQIWAKYVRIEFLTHFGNEYYCPISLLRIHGSRMLDSWKDSESNRDEEMSIDGDEDFAQNASQSVAFATPSSIGADATEFRSVTSWKWPFELNATTAFEMTCPTPTPVKGDILGRNPKHQFISQTTSQEPDISSNIAQPADNSTSTKANSTSAGQSGSISNTISANVPSITASFADEGVVLSKGSQNSTIITERQHNATATGGKVSALSGPNGKPRSSGTSGASAASPTMQEGFFNAITKRLQHVESNLTLSMKYVEDQSKHVQEALRSREQSQQAKITLFLDELNKTVLAELHNVLEQYDQIWQSTVLALESQRDRSERDMMALSARLNLLADEVVFQKRMAIVQAVILLSCLFLIIFSRGVSLPSLGPLLDHVHIPAYDTPTSPAISQQCSYRARNRPNRDSHIVPSSQILEEFNCKPNSNCSVRPSSAHFQTQCLQADTASPGRSIYQHLASPLSPDSSDDHAAPEVSDSATGPRWTETRNSLGESLINSRKPLPSLPEHPLSLNDE